MVWLLSEDQQGTVVADYDASRAGEAGETVTGPKPAGRRAQRADTAIGCVRMVVPFEFLLRGFNASTVSQNSAALSSGAAHLSDNRLGEDNDYGGEQDGGDEL